MINPNFGACVYFYAFFWFYFDFGCTGTMRVLSFRDLFRFFIVFVRECVGECVGEFVGFVVLVMGLLVFV